jgi:hypothetical protein
MTTIVNFSHPLTGEQLAAIARTVGVEPGAIRVIEEMAHFDESKPYAAQAETLIDATGLSSAEWQNLPILVNLPGHSSVAAPALSLIHGRSGHFPAVIRLRPVPNSVPRVFEFAEILSLDDIRDRARSER